MLQTLASCYSFIAVKL